MRILIGARKTRILYTEQFANALKKLGVETKVVVDSEVIVGFPTKKIKSWLKTRNKFDKLVEGFNPDIVFVDRPSYFGLAAIQKGLPLFVGLRGDLWSEIKSAKESEFPLTSRIGILFRQSVWQKCFENATMILPVCKYLEKIVNKHFPNKKSKVIHIGINPEQWFAQEGMKLNHPCVGLLQDATIWEKAKEMLTLTKVLEAMPDVTFYWAGDGFYKEKILSVLDKYENFKWLGRLQHPDEVREYLTEIDVYALISGLDMVPNSMLEAQLMKKPVIATKVGGIPELLIDKKTGYLIDQGDSKSLIDNLTYLLKNKEKQNEMGKNAHDFILKNFLWEVIAKEFIKIVKTA